MTLKSPQPPLAERAGAIARALGTDLAGLSGAVLIVAGIEMIHRPSALIVGGLILIALSVLAARRSE
jgi:hypothetical protein